MLSVVGDGSAAFAAGACGPRESKVDKVYLVLKQAIVSGALAPDTLIDKGDWSARFEVSRLSVTTAINRLAFERLAVIEPQRGSYVAKIRLTDVKQWMRLCHVAERRTRHGCGS